MRELLSYSLCPQGQSHGQPGNANAGNLASDVGVKLPVSLFPALRVEEFLDITKKLFS